MFDLSSVYSSFTFHRTAVNGQVPRVGRAPSPKPELQIAFLKEVAEAAITEPGSYLTLAFMGSVLSCKPGVDPITQVPNENQASAYLCQLGRVNNVPIYLCEEGPADDRKCYLVLGIESKDIYADTRVEVTSVINDIVKAQYHAVGLPIEKYSAHTPFQLLKQLILDQCRQNEKESGGKFKLNEDVIFTEDLDRASEIAHLQNMPIEHCVALVDHIISVTRRDDFDPHGTDRDSRDARAFLDSICYAPPTGPLNFYRCTAKKIEGIGGRVVLNIIEKQENYVRKLYLLRTLNENPIVPPFPNANIVYLAEKNYDSMIRATVKYPSNFMNWAHGTGTFLSPFQKLRLETMRVVWTYNYKPDNFTKQLEVAPYDDISQVLQREIYYLQHQFTETVIYST